MMPPPDCTWVSLLDPRACARELAGGKASTLAFLAQAGFPVPSGVVLPAGKALHADQAGTLIRDVFSEETVLAVRSSAFEEDQAEQSHAGQFKTALNVRGASALNAAVATVRASYGRSPLHPPASRGPVLIQRQVDAHLAGVCFTADPGSGIESLTVVEAVPGLGEALVSGRAEPMYVRLDRRTHQPVEIRGCDASGNHGRAFLHRAREVVAWAERIRDALSAGPLDIEWAWAGERFWLLQARPVTSPTFALPDRAPLTEPEIWSHGNFAETMPGAVPPLAWDVLRQATLRQKLPLGAERVLRELHLDPIECVAGRVCWNIGFLTHWGFLNEFSLRLMTLIDASMFAEIRKLHDRGAICIRREPSAFQRGWFFLAAGMLGTRVAWGALRAWRMGRRAAMDGMRDAARKLIRKSGTEDPGPLSPEEAWRRAHVMIREMWSGLQPHIGTFMMLGLPVVFSTLASRWSGRPMADVAGTALDQEASWARRMDESLRALGHTLRDAGVKQGDPRDAWPEKATAALALFLEDFGHRAPGEQDLSRLRFHERPDVVIELALQAAQSPGVRTSTGLTREQLLSEVRARGAGGSLRAALLRWVLPRAAHWAPVREDVKHLFWMPLWDRIRTLLLRTGQGLREQGVLERAEDVFLFHCAELDDLCAGGPLRASAKSLVEERRQQQARWARTVFPPVIRSDGVPVLLSAETEDGAWRGTPVSSGTYEGPVRVAQNFEDALRLEPGEVLVSAYLDPGWTALFPRAGALVMEVGGVVSHAAVIAREMGIPAIAGLPGATQFFKTGERVYVDGRTGLVKRIEHHGDS